MTPTIVLVAYAFFLILGGFFGFKKGSKISLIVGVSSGVLVLIGLKVTSVNPHVGWIFLVCLTGLLSLSFISRLIKTRKFMPSGMLLIITLTILAFCAVHLNA